LRHKTALAAVRTFGDRLAGSPEEIVDTMLKDLAVRADTPPLGGLGLHSPGGRACRSARPSRARWLLSEGAISLMLVHGDRSYAAAAAEAGKRLLQSPGSPRRPGRAAQR
jgi:hypothetical protein